MSKRMKKINDYNNLQNHCIKHIEEMECVKINKENVIIKDIKKL